MTKEPSLRHPSEIPWYIVCLVLNLLILAALIELVVLVWTHPALFDNQALTDTAIAILFGLILLPLAYVIYRNLTRAATRGSAVLVSEQQFPEIAAVRDKFAQELHLRRVPEVYVTSGNGQLNAFAASAYRVDFVVLHSELFANLYQNNREGLAFIFGHEMGHIRLSHTRLWYQLSLAFVSLVPIIPGFLSRAREYSSDRHGAFVEPQGEEGLVLLAAGRYVYRQVDVTNLLDQAAHVRGFWAEIAQLTQSHPLTIWRLKKLHDLGLFPRRRQGQHIPPSGAAMPTGA
ncbi:MAG TPA: M48 family metallopeptidase [Ktedonobacterales bacterium]|nr:M48 family metallopeptidase [Ktedonobacterales bacterium]